MKTKAFKAALPYTLPVCIGFLPFFIFPEGKEPPAFITYLGTVLPYAATGLLVIYCLKDAVFTAYHGLPELISIAAVCLLHKWKKNTLLNLLFFRSKWKALPMFHIQ